MLREHHWRCKINTFAFFHHFTPKNNRKRRRWRKTAIPSGKLAAESDVFFLSFGWMYVGSQGKSIEYAKIKSCYANNIGKPQPKSIHCMAWCGNFLRKLISPVFLSQRLRGKMLQKKNVMKMIPWCLYLPWRHRIIGLAVFFLAKLQVWPARPSLKRHYRRHVTNFHLQMNKVMKIEQKSLFLCC